MYGRPTIFLLAALATAPGAAMAQTVETAGEEPRGILDTGAPEFDGAGGWTIKPRGRMQIDVATVDLPPAGNDETAAEIRRFYLGVDGSIPGGFGYRLEADFAESTIELTDAYLTYEPADRVTLTLGQQKTFQGMEDLTSDLFTSMLERAAFTSAFGFERRVGLSGAYATDELVVQLGAFLDDAATINDGDSYSFDGRVVFSPKIGEDARLHLGGSAHWRDLNEAGASVRYRARPFVHTTDMRLVDTGAISASGERALGAELGAIVGPVHAVAEAYRMTAIRPGLDNATFWGGYAEIGVVVTPGDAPNYDEGNFDRIRPSRPVSAGGIGAIQFNARYDRLDLNDGAILGGRQQALGLSAIWVPVNRLRFVLNYAHLWIDDAAIPAGTDRHYGADTFGMRAQIDF